MKEALLNLDNYPLFSLRETTDQFLISPLGYETKKLDDHTIAAYEKQRALFLTSQECKKLVAKIKKQGKSLYQDETELELLADFVAHNLPPVNMGRTIGYLSEGSDLNTLQSQPQVNCIDITLLFSQLVSELLHIDGVVKFSGPHAYFEVANSGNIIDFGRNTAQKKRLFTPTEHTHEMIKNGKRPFEYLIKKTQRKILGLFNALI